MLEDMTGVMPLGQRITLHRIPAVNKSNQIQENLESLKINMHPKKLAQKIYYENSGRSPLLRDTLSENKKPVHERLGTLRKKKLMYNFSPNIRNKNKQNNINFRKNLAQARLQQIRHQKISDNILHNATLIPKLRLKRNPINYKILVKNENACRTNGLVTTHSVQGSLTTALQQEIRIIQLQNIVESNVIPNAPIITMGYGFTGVSTNSRFSSLP